jgi:hypothetical protein
MHISSRMHTDLLRSYIIIILSIFLIFALLYFIGQLRMIYRKEIIRWLAFSRVRLSHSRIYLLFVFISNKRIPLQHPHGLVSDLLYSVVD